MIIVSSPSAHMCRISDGWINLALIRKIEVDSTDSGVVVWSSGERESFIGEDMEDIIKICQEVEEKFNQQEPGDLEDDT